MATWRSLDDNALVGDGGGGCDDGADSNMLPNKCMSLKPLSPSQEKIILMESNGEDLRRLRQMKPLVRYQNQEVLERSNRNSAAFSASSPLYSHKRRRHKAYRQSSNISLYEELANSIEEDSPLPELCDINAR